MRKQIVPYQENDHDALVDIWYQAVCRTHTFLTDKDIQFYHHMIQSGALTEVEIWVEWNENNERTGFIGLDGTKIERQFEKAISDTSFKLAGAGEAGS
ncbi:hypothetical protein [Paenibacillus mendelii]|uniref:GNAT family N-acetyltransferase n=1 Tax=Paenibacillus mendelii TaxID=206163 RepID=A0ABV6J3D7_9BACL|nr:hypothetical protein [Paenibacillus mendelii]MCQ6563301.1 hypothetical protein [Paenibacillus mendelii]